MDVVLLRREIISKRKKMTEAEVNDKSKKVLENLTKLKEYIKAKNIMAYMPIDNEVEVTPLIDKLLDEKRKIALPVTKLDNVCPFYLNNMLDTRTGMFNILEPDMVKCIECSLDELDLVLVPGVLFSRNCERIGRGRGYYDRFLANMRKTRGKNVTFVGLAYEFQVFETIPQHENDVPMDFVVTEDQIYVVETPNLGV